MFHFRIASLTLAIGLLATTPFLTAQARDQLYTASHQQLEVTKVLLAQQSAWNSGDLDTYTSHYKDAPDT